MKTLFILMTLIFTTSALASRNPYCEDHRKIKTIMVKINQSQVSKILPNADWLEEKYRKQDQRRAVGIAGKTVVLLLLKRLTALSYVFEPTRAGVSSFTGFYVSSPENFSRFLDLPTQNACQYLSMNDSHAQVLRELTHTVWTELDYSRR